jgi:hypothetical protein
MGRAEQGGHRPRVRRPDRHYRRFRTPQHSPTRHGYVRRRPSAVYDRSLPRDGGTDQQDRQSRDDQAEDNSHSAYTEQLGQLYLGRPAALDICYTHAKAATNIVYLEAQLPLFTG